MGLPVVRLATKSGVLITWILSLHNSSTAGEQPSQTLSWWGAVYAGLQ
jgi:hypothetical protein